MIEKLLKKIRIFLKMITNFFFFFQSSNLLSATLCLVKELDYPSLEVVEHAVRCRIDELAVD